MQPIRRFALAALALLALVATPPDAAERCFPETGCNYIVPPGTQTIAAGGTIAADACGTVKNINAGSAVTTSTTNTFDAPESGNKGCKMTVCNLDTVDTITLDNNANFFSVAGTNVSLVAGACVEVVQTGTAWRQSAAVVLLVST